MEYKNVMVAIMDHSDNEKGDLFISTTVKGKAQALAPSEARILTCTVNIINA